MFRTDLGDRRVLLPERHHWYSIQDAEGRAQRARAPSHQAGRQLQVKPYESKQVEFKSTQAATDSQAGLKESDRDRDEAPLTHGV